MNLYHEMSLCNDNIQAMCDLSLTDQEATEMSNCFSVMESFREGVQNCSPTSCSCWAELALTVTGVQKCKDVGRDILKAGSMLEISLIIVQCPKKRRR